MRRWILALSAALIATPAAAEVVNIDTAELARALRALLAE